MHHRGGMSRQLSKAQKRWLYYVCLDNGRSEQTAAKDSLRALARHGFARKEGFMFYPTVEGRAENRRVNAREIAETDRTYKALGIPPVAW